MATVASQRSRVDGPYKVTGNARYTADTQLDVVTYGVFATAKVPSGRIKTLEVSLAEQSPGIVKVLTFRNLPKLNKLSSPPAGQTVMPLSDDKIYYEGEPVAMVVGESLEQTVYAASLVKVEFDQVEDSRIELEKNLDQAIPVTVFGPADSLVGNVKDGLAKSEVRVSETYRTSDRHHNAMEPSATIAEWNNGKLTLYDSTQWVWGARMVVATALGIPPEDVRVRSTFLGGGFGSKGWVWPHEILAAAAARVVGRRVKVVLPRSQDYTSHGHQPATEQTVELGASRDGRLLAIRHAAVVPTAIVDHYGEYAALGTRSMYACPAIETIHRAVPLNRPVPTPMRAPADGLSMVGLEIAMDELAVKLGMDPVELRMKNYADKDPTTGKPFSSKKLRECYSQGMERFGWRRRNSKPGSIRDGKDLIGWGMASVIFGTHRGNASARITIEKDASVLIEAGTQEIGTGAYTIMPQIAADVLKISPDKIRIVLGDTTLPETGGTFGSSTTASVGSAVYNASINLKSKLEKLARSPDRSYSKALEESGLGSLSAEGSFSPIEGDYELATFGAVFVEVKVDEDIPIPRVTRCLGVYSAGKIINPKTARSQMIGGMVWGIGQALLEKSVMEPKLGRFLSKNLSGYLVPVNADVPSLEAYFVEETDPIASPIGAKGIGELGAVGIGAAIANAVYHATGKRVRELPIAPEALM